MSKVFTPEIKTNCFKMLMLYKLHLWIVPQNLYETDGINSLKKPVLAFFDCRLTFTFTCYYTYQFIPNIQFVLKLIAYSPILSPISICPFFFSYKRGSFVR